MSFPERPPLAPHTCEKIDLELHKFDGIYWPDITAMRVKNYYPFDEPVPPQQPEHLLSVIKEYAGRLFKLEADYYEPFRADPRYGAWLSSLSKRIIGRVLMALDKLENGNPFGTILGFHGLTKPHVEKCVVLALSEYRRQYEQGTSESQRGALLLSSAAKDVYAPAQGATIEAPAKDVVKAKRKSLLDSYRENFPDVKLADIIWAAKQTRREWTRWTGGEAKDGLKADRSFRHVLTSGKAPEQIMGKPRPTKYNS